LFKMEFNMEWSKNGGRLTLQITIWRLEHDDDSTERSREENTFVWR
jgi:hypothetical protein